MEKDSSRNLFEVRYVPAWLPGVGFKRAILEGRKLVWRAHHVPYDMVKEKMVSQYFYDYLTMLTQVMPGRCLGKQGTRLFLGLSIKWRWQDSSMKRKEGSVMLRG